MKGKLENGLDGLEVVEFVEQTRPGCLGSSGAGMIDGRAPSPARPPKFHFSRRTLHFEQWLLLLTFQHGGVSA